MKKCSYCGTEYPDDSVVCPVDQTRFEKDYQPIVETESKRRPVIDENRKRIQELRQIAFQKLLVGIVLIFAVGCFYFMIPSDADVHSYSARKGLGLILLCGVLGLWNIVRAVIYLIRAQSGDEHYAKSVEDVLDKLESKQVKNLLGKQRKDYSTRNVLVLLAWVFLFLVVVGAIYVGYSFWTRP